MEGPLHGRHVSPGVPIRADLQARLAIALQQRQHAVVRVCPRRIHPLAHPRLVSAAGRGRGQPVSSESAAPTRRLDWGSIASGHMSVRPECVVPWPIMRAAPPVVQRAQEEHGPSEEW